MSIVHASGRPKPRPAEGLEASGGEEGRPLVRVKVWDGVVRSTHWLIALSFLALSITGIYIGDPYIVVPGEAGDHFVMGWMDALHFYAAIVFTLSVLARIVWAFVRHGHGHWRFFIPLSQGRRKKLVQTFLFYTFFRERPPPVHGHNPLAGLAYAAVFGLYLVSIATGLGLYAIGADVGSVMGSFDVLLMPWGGAQAARWVHHLVMWLLIGFFVHHLYSAILMAMVEKNGIIDSIVTGYKWVDVEDAEREELDP